jgi:hypothetical protein
VVADSAFTRLGLTDAAILMAAASGCLVLMADLNLHVELAGRGLGTPLLGESSRLEGLRR